MDNLLFSRAMELALYDWHYDVCKVFHKKISILCKIYDVNSESVIRFCVCHETGHAKEQRLFEHIGFFPNQQRRWPEGIPIRIGNENYLLTDNTLFDRFTCGMSDFSINEVLSKNNIKNQVAKMIFFDSTNRPSCTENVEWYKVVLDTLLSLPISLDIYEHCGLDEHQKRILKESQENVVGDKWEKTLSKLKCIDFF